MLRISPPYLTLFTLSATLRNALTGAPLANQPVTMTAAGAPVCTAITDRAGTATCAGFGAALSVVASLGYTATFNGALGYAPSSGTGALLS